MSRQIPLPETESAELLRHLADRLTTTLESITDAVYTLDRGWRFTYINKQAEKLLRRDRAELLGKMIWEEFKEAVNGPFYQAYHKAVAENCRVEVELFSSALSLWLDVHLYPSKEGLTVSLRDVTLRKREQEQLRLLETCIARLNDMVIITEVEPLDDPGPRIVFVNDAFERRTGYSPHEVLGKSPRFLQGPLTQRGELDRIRTALTKFEPIRTELINYTKSGEPFWLELDIVPITDASGVHTHFVAVERDITERKHAEALLAASEERFRFLHDLSVAKRPLADPGQIMALTARMLGEHLRVSRCAYADVAQDGEQFTVLHDYTDGCASAAGDYLLSLFGSRTVTTLQSGQTLIVRDVETELLPDEGADVFTSIGIKAIIVCPLVKEGVLRAMMAVHQTTPRDWQPDEITLVQDVVERCWTTIERRRAEESLQYAHDELEQANSELRVLFDLIPAMIWFKDTEDRILRVNQRVAEVAGVPLEAIEGKPSVEIYPDYAARFFADDLEVIHSGVPRLGVIETVQDPEGNPVWVQTDKVPVTNKDGNVTGIVVMAQDITARKLTEKLLWESEIRYRALAEAAPDDVFILNRSGIMQYANHHAAGKFDLLPEDFIGKSLDELFPGQEAQTTLSEIGIVFQSGEPLYRERYIAFPEQGIWMGVWWVPLKNAQGDVTEVMGVARNITRQKLEEEQRGIALRLAQDQADRDPLTEVLNHRAFHKRLEEEIARCRREKSTLAVVMLDLDNFKFFNDAYGHVVGDEVLRLVATHLQKICRPYDTIARFGGDEFALLLPSSNTASALEIEQRLMARLGDLSFQPGSDESTIPLTISLGVALYPLHGVTKNDLVSHADERLRRAKTGGESITEADQAREAMGRTLEGFSMLDALVTAVDNKDRYTRSHVDNVLTYCLQIARALGMNECEQKNLAAAALLHDVGKIGVPDAILRKPGKLTKGEYAAIRQHPDMGAAIVGAVPGLEGTLDAIRHHHENWDGSGYPAGLSGEDIPFIARLMAVADSYSAMTTDRPYRKGMSSEQALEILVRGAGSQWDPEIVQAFVKANLPTASGPGAQNSTEIHYVFHKAV